ncbi:tRNA lysidine(34) synthetase TilS [Lichenifustis flavocetrariae]|uniref:tRNA(Ile)-lysidine synthase n=1 Tax=Lichenifustis flavocetrariae TaxID=2949735 RepID=A0AA41YW46_9HYPH|nr:tRNA lysidine(34) synthetase TilS [Lichenifustis flavocetrariae]MCW6508242.1 tRNA lysidine(34) synthetase TilS [Lichenifustis flavocetrariae]
MPDSLGPVTTQSFDLPRLFRHLAQANGVVLAVSGGPDSTALMHLAAAWHLTSRVPLYVATVDHGLRAEAAAETEAVQAAAGGLGLPFHLLRWHGDKPRRAIQEKARDARHDLLFGLAADVGASHVATAHTLDDQAETLLFRLARGSGLRGLCGIRPVSSRNGLMLVRPLLNLRKETLVSLCIGNNWPFLQDPSNVDPRFARARWRRLTPQLAAEGLTPERLGALAERLARAEAALESAADHLARRCAAEASPDQRRFQAADLFAEPDELVLRVIEDALTTLVASTPVRLDRLEALVLVLRDSAARGMPLRRTLHHCTVVLDRHLVLTIQPEGLRKRGATA